MLNKKYKIIGLNRFRMKLNLKFTLLVLLAAFILSTKEAKSQQNIQFTQYIFNELAVNPAYAGYKEELYAQATHRIQWTGFEGAPTTTQISVDGVTNQDTRNIGLGLQITSDKLGAQFANSLYANYAFRMKLNDAGTSRLSMGIGAGITQYGLDGSLLSAINSDDQTLYNASASNFIPDVRVGVYYTAQKWYMGLSAMDLLSSSYSNNLINWNLSDSSQNVIRKKHYYFITGGLFDLSEFSRFRPSLLWKEDLKGPSVMDLSAMFIFFDKFWIGAAYRTSMNLWSKTYAQNQSLSAYNAICGIAQFVVDDNLRIGYSYDYTLNTLGFYQLGTHELTIGYTFRKKPKRVLSPRFF